MDVTGMFLTHIVARQSERWPFFFSRWIFERAKKRGNTHFCFYCGGDWGFKPGPNGEVLDSKSHVVTLDKSDTTLRVQEAINNSILEPFLSQSPGYRRRDPKDRGYKEWLTYQAHFDWSEELESLATEHGYTIYRYDPMERHDPVRHANGILSGMDKHDWVGDWFENVTLPEGFPFVVSLT